MFDIVTVTFNNLHGLKKTIESLHMQEDKNFRLVVIDGLSTDGTGGYLRNLEVDFDFHFIIEKDNGIYDAMNKGVLHVVKNFVWFLNAGDTCYNSQTTSQISQYCLKSPGSHHFFAVKMHGKNWGKIKYSMTEIPTLIMSMPVCHQGMIIKSSSIKKLKYNTSFSIAADHDYLIRSIKSGDKYINHKAIIANFDLDGISSHKIFMALKQQYRSSLGLISLGVPRYQIVIAYGARIIRALLAEIARKTNIYSFIQKYRFNGDANE